MSVSPAITGVFYVISALLDEEEEEEEEEGCPFVECPFYSLLKKRTLLN
jgi:hypothetical protein